MVIKWVSRLALLILLIGAQIGEPSAVFAQQQVITLWGIISTVQDPSMCGTDCTTSPGDLIKVSIYIDPSTPDLSPFPEWGLYSLRTGSNRLEIEFAGKTWSSTNVQSSPNFAPNALFYVLNNYCCLPSLGYYDGIAIEGFVAASPTDDPNNTLYLNGHLFGIDTIFASKSIPNGLPPVSTFEFENIFSLSSAIGEFIEEPEQVIVNVDIDIKPGSDPNCFNNNGAGVIPVAILGSTDLDVTNIDPGSVVLEGMSVKAVGKSNKLLAHIGDVNSDGFDDLVVQIEDDDGIFSSGSSTATLTGSLDIVTLIEGTDNICIVP